jgi:hypothetical protein
MTPTATLADIVLPVASWAELDHYRPWWAPLAAQVKAIVDRAQVFRSRKYVLKLPVVPPERKGKRLGIFLSTAGQKWDNVFDAAIPSVKCFYHVIDIRDADIRYMMINGVDEKGAIEHHPSAKTDAVNLGRKTIKELKKRLDV